MLSTFFEINGFFNVYCSSVYIVCSVSVSKSVEKTNENKQPDLSLSLSCSAFHHLSFSYPHDISLESFLPCLLSDLSSKLLSAFFCRSLSVLPSLFFFLSFFLSESLSLLFESFMRVQVC